MLFTTVTLMIGAVAANIIPYADQIVFRNHIHEHDDLQAASPPSQCPVASIQSDVLSIANLEMEPLFDGDDYMHFTPVNSQYTSDEDEDSLSATSKILLEHKINGREGGVFFEFCEIYGPPQKASNQECPPTKQRAVEEVLDWLLFDMPAANYPFRYVSETTEGTGMFCVNGTTWDDRYNVQTEQLEL